MKKFTKITYALSLALSVFLGFNNAQASTQDNIDKQNTLKVYYYSLNDLFINQLSASLQERAIASQLKLAQYDANGDLLHQIDQIQNTVDIDKNQAPIFVNPVDTKNGSTALSIAAFRKLPIVFFNRSVDKDAFLAYQDAWYVGTDGSQAGFYQAQIVSEYIKAHPEVDRNKDGYISYIMLKGEAGHQDTESRTGSFIRTMLSSDIKLKPVAAVNADWSQSKAIDAMRNIINTHGMHDIELVVCNNDAMALGAIMALQNEGYNHPKATNRYVPVVGIDALPSALDAIERGTMIGTVLNDHKSMADVMIRISEAYIKGIEINEALLGYKINNRNINIPYVKVTKQNIDSVRE